MVMTMDYEQKYKVALELMQGMYGGLHGKTKKPKWNENDEHHLRMCLECVEECATQEREDFSKTIDWLKSLKQRMEEQ